jgi:serine/threonine protein kinase
VRYPDLDSQQAVEAERVLSDPSRLPSNCLKCFDNHTLVEQLAAKSSTKVELVQDPETHSLIVVKTYRHPDDHTTERMVKEFAIIHDARFHCFPRFVGWFPPFFETGPQIATEFCPNGSLEQVLKLVRAGNPPQFWTHTNIAKFVVGVAIGLGSLHSLGIVHTDVTPQNLRIDSKFHVRISGLSHAKVANLSEEAKIHEPDPLYSAPEMENDDEAKTGKVDVFSFAAIVYEIMFGATAATERLRGERPSLPEGVLSNSIRRTTERCWSLHPDERPWFDEVVADLRIGDFKLYPDVDGVEVKSYLAGQVKHFDFNS